MMVDKFPIELCFAKPSQELRIVNLRGGQTIFPGRRAEEVIVFVEFNGYRRPVFFPRQPADPETK